MVSLWFYHQYHSTNVLQNSSFRFLQHDLRNFLKQKEALLNLEREAKETEDQQITWQKNEQSYDRDEDDDFELLNSFFKGRSFCSIRNVYRC